MSQVGLAIRIRKQGSLDRSLSERVSRVNGKGPSLVIGGRKARKETSYWEVLWSVVLVHPPNPRFAPVTYSVSL